MDKWHDHNGSDDGFYTSRQARNAKPTAMLATAMTGKKRNKLFSIYRPNTGLQSKAETIEEIKKKYKRVGGSLWWSIIHPFLPLVPQTAWLVWWYFYKKHNFPKIFDGEVLSGNKLTSLIQILFLCSFISQGYIRNWILYRYFCYIVLDCV